MQCQLCDRAATVHLTEIVNGQKAERHLCEYCAQQEGITIKAHVPISELLDNLVSAQEASDQLTDLSCPQCQLTWGQFRKQGLLGCPNDYLAFDEPLSKLIKKAQEGAAAHVGRFPEQARETVGRRTRLLQLRQKLREAVSEEDYERAAQLRDEIDTTSSDQHESD